LEKDRSNIVKSWRELEILVKDRGTWNEIVQSVPCASIIIFQLKTKKLKVNLWGRAGMHMDLQTLKYNYYVMARHI
jgi:hypothetical protein